MTNPFVNVNSITLSTDNTSLLTEIEWTRKSVIGPDPKGNLIITFKHDGERYEYTNVPSSVLQEMLASESFGKYFHANIKDQYDTYKEI